MIAVVYRRHSGLRMSTSITWRTVVTSSSILSLALVGDALIYAVLPVHAEAFGVSLVWVGVLLSANRFVRVLAYGWIARSAQRFGLRRLCIAALLAAIVSTAMYGLATGAAALLLARILWGLAFAGLLLVTLGHAVHDRARVGSRLGWSRAIQHVGPVLALIAGAWLTGCSGAAGGVRVAGPVDGDRHTARVVTARRPDRRRGAHIHSKPRPADPDRPAVRISGIRSRRCVRGQHHAVAGEGAAARSRRSCRALRCLPCATSAMRWAHRCSAASATVTVRDAYWR